MRVKIPFFLILPFLVVAVLVCPRAQAYPDKFTVRISGVEVTRDTNISPCFPITGFFTHPDPAVTKVRMEWPVDPSKYFVFPVNKEVHIKFHEDQMRRGDNPYSDFVALDEEGQEHGRIRMIFWAPEDPDDNRCQAVIS